MSQLHLKHGHSNNNNSNYSTNTTIPTTTPAIIGNNSTTFVDQLSDYTHADYV
jgi:hypothetical protein